MVEACAYHFGQVVQGVATVDRVYAHGLLAEVRGAGLFEELAQVRSGLCFLARGDGVFEVVGHAVDVQPAGFVQHPPRGAGDWMCGQQWLVDWDERDVLP